MVTRSLWIPLLWRAVLLHGDGRSNQLSISALRCHGCVLGLCSPTYVFPFEMHLRLLKCRCLSVDLHGFIFYVPCLSDADGWWRTDDAGELLRPRDAVIIIFGDVRVIPWWCCLCVFSLSSTGVGFILVIDRRQDRWASVKGTLLRIAVSLCVCACVCVEGENKWKHAGCACAVNACGLWCMTLYYISQEHNPTLNLFLFLWIFTDSVCVFLWMCAPMFLWELELTGRCLRLQCKKNHFLGQYFCLGIEAFFKRYTVKHLAHSCIWYFYWICL